MVASSPRRGWVLPLCRGFYGRAAGREIALHPEPVASERAHVLDQRQQRAALRREHVLDARRHLGVGLARDDALLLERLSLSESVRGLIPFSERSSSQKRLRPAARSRMMRIVHLPQTISAVAHTGQVLVSFVAEAMRSAIKRTARLQLLKWAASPL